MKRATVCKASGCILVRHRRWVLLSTTEPEDRSFRAIAAAYSRYRLTVVDHLGRHGRVQVDVPVSGLTARSRALARA